MTITTAWVVGGMWRSLSRIVTLYCLKVNFLKSKLRDTKTKTKLQMEVRHTQEPKCRQQNQSLTQPKGGLGQQYFTIAL